ncbi:hypothetical protein IEQ34_018585 [Dendrobium chrysotoxum]|uniref:Nuclear pore complex protein NUP155 n=1 Tax=Dendrobium chrysotoxum TaxID=161865 RepID=A0AAV7G4H7_DENCH|nr:hypothetical protein IEQ34_018585 [Dendrobium chrysotoxum]
MTWEDEIIGTDVASAGLHISECIGRDAASQLDLEEALEASRYTSHPYSSQPKEWPPVAEVLDTRELPAVLIERYNASGGEGTALCGIFPEIRRAWASVDNSLFLWRFDKRDGQCTEYSGEEQSICAAGLARVKPGIFIEAIQYILVVATPVENFGAAVGDSWPFISLNLIGLVGGVMANFGAAVGDSWPFISLNLIGLVGGVMALLLIGVCCAASADGTDPYAEISLQPLPEYTMPSDGVTMTCFACMDNGQIYVSGRDGHIYEIQYSSGSGWRKPCRKVCLTAGFGTLVSKWILPNALKFGAVDPIVDMVIDNERHVLYARTEAMKLQVFDLGVGGSSPLKKIAEERNLIDPRDLQYRGRRAGSRAIAQAKPSIVSIAPVSTMESKWLHMVAVLSDGRRLYVSTSPSSVNNASVSLTGLGNAVQRPSCLKVVATRPSPPLGVGGGLTFGAISAANRAQPEDMALKVETAFYSAGMFVLSDSSAPAVSSLLIVNRDTTTQLSHPSNLGISSRNSRALRELVSSLPVEGRMLCVTDVLPLPDTAATVHSLYSDLDAFGGLRESCEKASAGLWARGDLPTQHILPRRKIIVFSTMGLMEIVFNRPVDILRRLFESNAPKLQIEEFFNRFGSGEAAAMCLMLAAKLISDEENIISNSVSERAAETFEDPVIVGMPQLESNAVLSSVRAPAGGFSMGQVVPEAEPLFSGAHEGLCLCASRLLFPVWELPVMTFQREIGSDGRFNEGVICCRLPSSAMQVLESKIRSLEQFLRSRRNKRRGLYGSVAGRGDFTGSILYGTRSDVGANSQNEARNLFGLSSTSTVSGDAASNKRQRLLHTSAELAAIEVRAMECLRRLLRRSSEALFLLQIVYHHHVTRLVQALDSNVRQKLVHLTFNQLVCSDEGDQLAMQLISGLMEYYTGTDGRGTVDEISAKLREGCPSYFNESDYKYFLAVECLERAFMTYNAEERENLARAAFNHLTKVPESVDLRAVCKRFEDLRFYEAVVRLPLQKAQALDHQADAFNVKLDPDRRDNSLVQREQCYETVMNALRSLKGDVGKVSRSGNILDQASRDKYIRQIIQLSVQWPDTAFHEHLYRTLIELGLENELLEYGGSDLVSFLQSAGRKLQQEVQAVAAPTPITTARELETPIPSSQTKYLDLLARYYVMKRQHLQAAHVLYRLAERQCTDAADAPTLDQRRQYLSNAVLQAKSAISINGSLSSTMSTTDNGLLDMLEAKLAVLRFQMKIKEELESIAFKLEGLQVTSESHPNDPFPRGNLVFDANTAKIARGKAKELELNLKSITQLYNDYAVPFQLWEICLEMLNFANYSGDADSKIVRETWARLVDQALSSGGIAEACAVLKRVGSNLYPVDGSFIPLDALCLHLEKAALERLSSGIEVVGDEEIARSLLAACRGRPEPILSVYDQLLSNGAIVPSQNLRLRLLRSVLVVLREWVMLVLADKLGTTTTGASFMFGGTSALEQTSILQKGIRDKIVSATNRYMTEVRRLALPQSQIEPIYQGFKELEEKLLTPSSFPPY